MEMAPRERFELSNPCEYALYGFLEIPGARPTRLGDLGICLLDKNHSKSDYIVIF